MKLELMAPEALSDLPRIGRSVVALLNRDGGEVRIALRDENRAELQRPLPSGYWRQRLADYLVDSIEPSPEGSVAVVLEMEGEPDRPVLRVLVEPLPERRPYALLEGWNRTYVVHTGTSVRPLTREELFPRTPSDERRAVTEALRQERTALQEEGRELLWLRIQPVRDLDLDLGAEDVETLLLDPRASGNREGGWHLIHPYRRPRLRADKLVAGRESTGVVELHRRGFLVLRLPLAKLRHLGDPRDLWPLKLLEYPTSLFRLARTLYASHLEDGDLVLSELAMVRAAGWCLRPHSPAGWQYRQAERRHLPALPDLVWPTPLAFPFEELRRAADRCGVRWISRVYRAFGFGEEDLPEEYDRGSGHLVLAEEP